MRSVNAGFRKHWRLASSTACSVLALVLGGCGAGNSSSTAMLPADVGSSLAAETAEVEDALAASDYTVAHEEALDLRDRVNAASDAGDVPEPLRRPLLAAVTRLIGSIPKAQPREENGKDEGDENGENGKGEGKGNGKESATITTDITTVAGSLDAGSGDG